MLLFLVFFGNANLSGRAQKEFIKFENSLKQMFPFEEAGNLPNLKDLGDVSENIIFKTTAFFSLTHLFAADFEQKSVERVVAILQNNVKQWSFVETQLLEPNINMGMVSK